MNFGSAGPQLRLVPDAAAGDGHFDVVLAEEQHRGHDGGSAAVPVAASDRPRAAGLHGTPGGSDVRRRVHVDDRLRAGERRLELTVERHALTFLV
jgi:hypothetical protein